MTTLTVVCLVIFLIAVSLIPTARDRAQARFWEQRRKDIDGS